MVTISSKQCSCCCNSKPVSEFYRNRYSRDGYRSRCKACHAKQVRTYASRVQAALYQRRYYREHRDYYARWREEHREAYRAFRRESYARKRLERSGRV